MNVKVLYPINDEKYLLNLFQHNLDNFYNTTKKESCFIYPINFEDFILENSSKYLFDLYLNSVLKFKRRSLRKVLNFLIHL